MLANTDEPVTNGGLTLDEVLLRFRHPNGGVRKESLGGLKDILNVGVSREVGKVVRAIGGLVSDDVRGLSPLCQYLREGADAKDAGVRKALLNFLGWYIPSLPEVRMMPT